MRTGYRFSLTNEGCQPHIFDHVRLAIEEWGWVVPPWVDTIRVTFSPDDSGTICCKPAEEYRVIYLRVCNGWAKVPENQRGRWIMHELIHAHFAHLYEAFNDLVYATTEPESPLRKWAEEQQRRAVERGVNDLERALWQHHTEEF